MSGEQPEHDSYGNINKRLVENTVRRCQEIVRGLVQQRIPASEYDNLLHEIFWNTRADLDEMLLGLLGSPQLVKRWWQSPNLAFDLQTPDQVWSNDPDQVRQYIYNQYR